MNDLAGADGALSATVIERGASQLGLTLSPLQTQQLQTLASELLRWNKAYNLTAIDRPADVLTQHLLDSLSAHATLQGEQIADVGTGAGFPGLPLAILHPQRQFTLIDAVDKKLRFIDHVARTLGLANVRTRHARVEQLGPGFDTVICRAFAPLPRLVQLISPLVGPQTRVIAMKGRWPPEQGSDDAGPLPPDWRIADVQRVTVPGLDAERHLLWLVRSGAG